MSRLIPVEGVREGRELEEHEFVDIQYRCSNCGHRPLEMAVVYVDSDDEYEMPYIQLQFMCRNCGHVENVEMIRQYTRDLRVGRNAI